MKNIKLLDCTLRDGGYLNDWEFGHDNILSIYQRQVLAGIDIVEIGFLDDRRPFDINRTIMPETDSVEKIYGLLPQKAPMTVGMIDYGTCDIANIKPCKDSWLDGIRVIFKKGVMHEAMDFCRQLKQLGYKVFSQLVSITSYSDEELLEVIDLVNKVEPYAVSMVDTYGLLTPLDLLHYYDIMNQKVNESISIGFHAHNNLQLGVANVITFLQKETKHDIIVDGTLYGMGKSAGNDPIEIVAMYLNEHYKKNYDIDQILEAIEESIIDLYHKYPWDYKVFFYLQSKNACHPKYVSFLQDKSNLSVTDMDQLLGSIEPEDKKLLHDEKVGEKLYEDYLLKQCDAEAIKQLAEYLKNRDILLLGPGKNIILQADKVKEYIEKRKPVSISVNYLPISTDGATLADMVFVTNSKRYLQMTETLLQKENQQIKIMATSNVTAKIHAFDFIVNREPLLERDEAVIDNSFLMLLKVLKKAGVRKVTCAGFDGYSDREDNYFKSGMEYSFLKGQAGYMNRHIRKVIGELSDEMEISFLTYSNYNLEY